MMNSRQFKDLLAKASGSTWGKALGSIAVVVAAVLGASFATMGDVEEAVDDGLSPIVASVAAMEVSVAEQGATLLEINTSLGVRSVEFEHLGETVATLRTNQALQDERVTQLELALARCGSRCGAR